VRVKRATIGCLRVAVTCGWPGMPGPIPFGMGGWMAEARIELPMDYSRIDLRACSGVCVLAEPGWHGA
jgi:hypothetical protein